MEGVGATAQLTAAARARESQRPDRLLEDPPVHALLQTTGELSCGGSSLGTDMSSAMLAAPSRAAWMRFYADAGAPLVFGTDRPAELLAERGWLPTLYPYVDVARELGAPGRQRILPPRAG